MLSSPATARRLHALHDGKVLSDAALARALTLANEPPSPEAWRGFVSRTALILGGLLCLSAAVFFIAHNWAHFDRWSKFALLELSLAGCVAAAFKAATQLTRQLAITAAAIVLGPLLALYGQTYQTGADAFELFAVWAIFAAPLAVLSRFTPLWLITWALGNLALGLWCTQLAPLGIDLLFSTPLLLALFNAVGAVLFRLCRPGRYGVRVLAAATVLAPLPISVWSILSWNDRGWLTVHSPWSLPNLAVTLLGSLLAVALFRTDRFMRSLAGFVFCSLATALATRRLWDLFFDNDRSLIALGLFVVLQITLVAWWVLRTPRPLTPEPA